MLESQIAPKMKTMTQAIVTTLGPVDQQEAIDILWDDLQDESRGFPPELIAELDRRIAEDDANPGGATSYEDWCKENGLVP